MLFLILAVFIKFLEVQHEESMMHGLGMISLSFLLKRNELMRVLHICKLMTMLEYHMLKINQVLLAISCNGHFWHNMDGIT